MNAAAGKRHMERVAQLPCVLCWFLHGAVQTRGEVHHVFDPSDRNPFLTVKLCEGDGTERHHRGPNGFHGLGGERPFKLRYGVGEVQLLAWTLELLAS